MGAGQSGTDYPTAVVSTLVVEFPDLADPTTAEIVRAALARQHQQPQLVFECIVDHPTLSNWKLVPRRDAPSRVRLACFRPQPSAADREREQRVNEALERLTARAAWRRA